MDVDENKNKNKENENSLENKTEDLSKKDDTIKDTECIKELASNFSHPGTVNGRSSPVPAAEATAPPAPSKAEVPTETASADTKMEVDPNIIKVGIVFNYSTSRILIFILIKILLIIERTEY